MGLKSKTTPKNRIRTKKSLSRRLLTRWLRMTYLYVIISQNRGPVTFLALVQLRINVEIFWTHFYKTKIEFPTTFSYDINSKSNFFLPNVHPKISNFSKNSKKIVDFVNTLRTERVNSPHSKFMVFQKVVWGQSQSQKTWLEQTKKNSHAWLTRSVRMTYIYVIMAEIEVLSHFWL